MLEPYSDKVIICDPRHSRWIAQEGFANDRTSAIKLTKLCRGRYIKDISHLDDTGASLRSLFLHNYDLNCQTMRFKLKLKAIFRQIGIRASSQSMNQDLYLRDYLEQLDAGTPGEAVLCSCRFLSSV